MKAATDKLKIGIMGGTFDPIHNGHLVAAQEAYYRFGLDKVIFMPAGVPPHKQNKEVLEAKQRYLMTIMATEDNDIFEVSDLEVSKNTPSYTVETLRALREIYKQSEFYFITGADAIIEIPTWKEPDKVAALAKFVAATRPGFSMKKSRESISKIMPTLELYKLEIPALAVSSTDIRKRVLRGAPIRYFLPDKVWRYIFSKGFYSD